jgi:predicted transcriptional regulator
MNNLHKANEGRKQRAAERRVTMQKLAAKGTPDRRIAEELGVTEKTVRNQLVMARKDPFTITEDNRKATLDELLELKNEVKSHRKGNKPLPLAAVDRLIKIAEVVMRLEGTAAPTKSLTANVNLDQQVIPIEQQLEYLNAFAGLYDDERLEELDRVKARKRTCRVVMDAHPFAPQLESGS